MLLSFVWTMGGLSIGWVIINIHQVRTERTAIRNVQEDIKLSGATGAAAVTDLAAAIRKEKGRMADSKTWTERLFSLKALHGAIFFTSWLNIAGRVFATGFHTDRSELHSFPPQPCPLLASCSRMELVPSIPYCMCYALSKVDTHTHHTHTHTEADTSLTLAFPPQPSPLLASFFSHRTRAFHTILYVLCIVERKHTRTHRCRDETDEIDGQLGRQIHRHADAQTGQKRLRRWDSPRHSSVAQSVGNAYIVTDSLTRWTV